jgi:hypothetical protein
MRLIEGDLFEHLTKVDVICITTNGYVKKDGEAVMGRGCALTAANMFPTLPRILGDAIRDNGNVVSILANITGGIQSTYILSFPVKHNWWEEADIKLIEKSAQDLVQQVTSMKLKTIVIPRPGCGNGKLDWETHVMPTLRSILDDRFYIIDFKKSKEIN